MDTVTRPRSRLWRWWPVLAVATTMLVPLALAGFLWLSNTRELTIVHVVDRPVAPGGTITLSVDPGVGGCGPSYEWLYRESLGRWRQTHQGSGGVLWSRDEVSIWSWPRTRTEFSSLPCPIGGAATLTIPDDVTWSPVVACTFGNSDCVRVGVGVAP